MKTFLFLTILTASGLTFFSSCRTTVAPRTDLRVMSKQRGTPRPYYQSNSEGRYYYKTEADTNTNYKPQVRRN